MGAGSEAILFEEKVCAICLEPVTDGSLALRCAHVYHRACICRWLRVAPRCPQCGLQVDMHRQRRPTLADGSLVDRMDAAEAQLRAARRISLANDRHLQWLEGMQARALARPESTRLGSAGSSPRTRALSGGARLRYQLEEASAAASAASDLLQLIEMELHDSPTPSGARLPPAERTQLRRGERIPHRHNHEPRLSSRPASARVSHAVRGLNHPLSRPPSASIADRPSRASSGMGGGGQEERQRRAATQMVRAQLRVAERQTPRIVRPSQRGHHIGAL